MWRHVVAMGHRAQVVGQQHVDPVALQRERLAARTPASRRHSCSRTPARTARRRRSRGVRPPMGRPRRDGFEPTADLGRDHHRVVTGQGLAQPGLAEAEAVVRGGVEIADAGRQGRLDHVCARSVAHRGIEVADRPRRRSPARQARQRWTCQPSCALPSHSFIKSILLIKFHSGRGSIGTGLRVPTEISSMPPRLFRGDGVGTGSRWASRHRARSGPRRRRRARRSAPRGRRPAASTSLVGLDVALACGPWRPFASNFPRRAARDGRLQAGAPFVANDLGLEGVQHQARGRLDDLARR
jgi:hypothetical protein